MHDTCIVVGHIVCVDLCAIIVPKVVFLAIFDIIEIDFYVFITIHPCVLVEESKRMHELM